MPPHVDTSNKPPKREALILMGCRICSRALLGPKSIHWWTFLDATDRAKYPEMATILSETPYCSRCAEPIVESRRKKEQQRASS